MSRTASAEGPALVDLVFMNRKSFLRTGLHRLPGLRQVLRAPERVAIRSAPKSPQPRGGVGAGQTRAGPLDPSGDGTHADRGGLGGGGDFGADESHFFLGAPEH